MTQLKVMRKILFVTIISSIVLIVGCSNKNLVTEPDASKESLGEKYGFTSFDITIDTKELKEALIANYNEKRDKTEAIYKNQAEDLYLNGNKAMKKLDTLFEELSLDPDMDAEDIIKKASETFGIIDYKTLKLKVQFKGHDKKELMMTK